VVKCVFKITQFIWSSQSVYSYRLATRITALPHPAYQHRSLQVKIIQNRAALKDFVRF